MPELAVPQHPRPLCRGQAAIRWQGGGPECPGLGAKLLRIGHYTKPAWWCQHTRNTREHLNRKTDHKTAHAMIFRLMVSARNKGRKISGPNRLPERIEGVEFQDGIRQLETDFWRWPSPNFGQNAPPNNRAPQQPNGVTKSHDNNTIDHHGSRPVYCRFIRVGHDSP